jgi:DNA (cytosine-5)-methyltransferase 1
MMENEIRIISLFSGCGGMDLGFLSAQNPNLHYKVVWANDFDKLACETYKVNIGNEIECSDIWGVEFEKLPDADGVIGGFPCEDFSIVRGDTRPGFESKRGLLYTRLVDAINAKQPLFFLAENVKGLLNIDHGRAIKKVIEDFSSAGSGYNVNYKLINFADYGVPQTRERVIIVGIRKDLGFKFEFPTPTHAGKHVSSKEALAGVEKVNLNNEKLKMRETTRAKLELIPPGGNYKNLPGCSDKNWMSLIYKRLHPDMPSPTLVAAGGGGTWGYHYKEARPLTNRERARIQTFPDTFKFIGSVPQVRLQIGNAVPPLGIKPIAEQLLKLLENEHGSAKQIQLSLTDSMHRE